jgi:hypothetical protein
MPGWKRMVVGAALGAAGALYATNEEFRKALPGKARDLPVASRRRFEAATTAAREASALRRAEILRELEAHGGGHAGRSTLEASQEDTPPGIPASPQRVAGESATRGTERSTEEI